MKNSFYSIKLLKLNKSTYRIVLLKKTFFEILGSYRPARRSFDLEFVFLDRDRLIFWLGKGAICEISAYKFLQIFLVKYDSHLFINKN